MQITNKKIIKNFSDILSSSIKAKDLITVEIDKVDAKYAELAKKEKAELVKQMSILESQIATYSALLGETEPECPTPSEEDATEESTVKTVDDEKVVDTLFPENNDGNSEDVKSESVTTESKEDFSNNEEPVESNDDEATDDSTDSNEEWPALPEEW